MSNLRWFWGWLLPGLVCLSPMGALAYWNAGADEEASHGEPPPVEPRVYRARRGSVVIVPIALL
jgi:hypothetical protein